MITRMVNRLINLSPAMYVVENFNTLAEIKITVLAYISLVLSIINITTTGAVLVGSRLHSINNLKSIFRQYTDGTRSNITNDHIAYTA